MIMRVIWALLKSLLANGLCFFSCVSPAAHTYFVEYIAKAYQALTDPVSRENFEKYGHPDGRQVIYK